jgi:hypothetical protein
MVLDEDSNENAHIFLLYPTAWGASRCNTSRARLYHLQTIQTYEQPGCKIYQAAASRHHLINFDIISRKGLS